MDDTEPTVKLRNPNWRWSEVVGFAEHIDIIQPLDWDDEPTLPFGLCRSDAYESAEMLVEEEEFLVGEQDIIDELTDEDVETFVREMNRDYDVAALVREYINE
jgi:hypothetical protein